MSTLRQKLLTDFYQSPEKFSESADTSPLPNINCKPQCVACPNSENEGFFGPLSSAKNYPLSVSSTTATTSKVIRTVIVSEKENKRRRRMLADDPKQMILDAGQKQFGHQQCKQVSLLFSNYLTREENNGHFNVLL